MELNINEFYDGPNRIIVTEKQVLCPYCRHISYGAMFLGQHPLLEGRFTVIERFYVKDYETATVQQIRHHYNYMDVVEGSYGQHLATKCLHCRGTIKLNGVEAWAKVPELQSLLALDENGDYVLELEEDEVDELLISWG